MISKPKISTIVAQQFPEFVREDYPKFIAFVEAYYEFLNQYYKDDLYELRDIDTTLDEFLQLFRKELSINVPYTKVNERFMLSHIKEQYLSKGSEASFKLLFRLLFNKEVEIAYPSKQILRASDGKWTQEVSIFLDMKFGNPENIVGKTLTVTTPTKTFQVIVDRYEPVEVELPASTYAINPNTQVSITNNMFTFTNHGLVTGTSVLYSSEGFVNIGGLVSGKTYYIIRVDANRFMLAISQSDSYAGTFVDLTSLGSGNAHTFVSGGIKQPSPNIFEVFVDRKFFGDISRNDIVTYTDEFRGIVLSTTTKVDVVQSGINFKVGELYELRNGNGSGSILKVSKINEQGGILSAQIIKFGVDYGSDFINTLVSYTDRQSAPSNTLEISIPNVGIGEVYSSITERGTLNTHNYNNDDDVGGLAFDPTYAGEVVREFYYDNSQIVSETTTPAIVYIRTGGIAKYPGYYSTNDGFLDDAIYLQDSYYYQAFSYVVKVDEQLETYKSILKTLLHPAGMALFGEYDIRNTFDLGASLQEASRIIILSFQEEVFVLSSVPIKSIHKPLQDSVTTTELTTYTLDKYIDELDDNVPVVDIGGIWNNDVYWDISYALDPSGYYTDEGLVYEF